MRRTLFFIIAPLGIASSFAACRPKQPGLGGLLYDGPTGSTGANGLLPDVYHTYKTELANAMQFPLITSPPPKTLNTTFDPILRGSPTSAVRTLVDYAISCAVPMDTVMPPTGGYKGSNSLLNTTTKWSLAKLDPSTATPRGPSPQEDLHTCIATRLNPSGAPVDIWLGGLNVVNDLIGDPTIVFPIEEAYWATIKKQPGGVGTIEGVGTINVWPSPDLYANCSIPSVPGTIKAGTVSDRVCGRGGSCDLEVRDDSTKCVTTRSGVICPRDPTKPDVDQPVIQTRMKCADWCTFYPHCSIPGICQRDLDAGVSVCPTDAGAP